MTPEEYIATLSVDEMRYVLGCFWDWVENDGCPWSNDKEYDCDAEENEFGVRECVEDGCYQLGCWLKYYVWQYRKNKEKRKREENDDD